MGENLTTSDQSHCLNMVKEHASDLYLCDLLLPEPLRHEIAVIHAFHVEITNITLSMGDPMASQIRLQWWCDVIDGQRDEEAQGHPVARALLDLIKRHKLPQGSFVAKAQAHIFDLYNDPMGDRTMFEGYCGETRSCLFQWAVLIAGPTMAEKAADASGHAGVAVAIVNILENMAVLHNHGRVHVPSDLLRAVGLDGAAFLSKPGDQHRYCIEGLLELAWEHHAKALTALDEFAVSSGPKPSRKSSRNPQPVALRLVYKPLAPLPVYLKSVQRDPLAVFGARRRVSQLKKQWAMWRF